VPWERSGAADLELNVEPSLRGPAARELNQRLIYIKREYVVASLRPQPGLRAGAATDVRYAKRSTQPLFLGDT
jgi:hypothetical protein